MIGSRTAAFIRMAVQPTAATSITVESGAVEWNVSLRANCRACTEQFDFGAG